MCRFPLPNEIFSLGAAELEERGLITTERSSIMTRDGRKWNGCLRYHILPIQMSIDQFTERQLRRLEAGAARQKAQVRLSRLCEEQEKRQASPYRRLAHFCPQCGQLTGDRSGVKSREETTD